MSTPIALVSRDDYAVPADLPERIAAVGGDLRQRDCADGAAVIDAARGAAVVWVFGGGRMLTESVLAALPDCRMILRSGRPSYDWT